MILDTNIFHPGAKIAVNCVSNDEAIEFIAALKGAFPSAVRRTGFETNNHWSSYESRTCYAFWTWSQGAEPGLTYCDSDFYKNSGYDVVSIYDAMTTGCVVEDINLDDAACISCLFGG